MLSGELANLNDRKPNASDPFDRPDDADTVTTSTSVFVGVRFLVRIVGLSSVSFGLALRIGYEGPETVKEHSRTRHLCF